MILEKHKELVEFYIKANQSWQYVFLDVLNDLIGAIDGVNKLTNYCLENREYVDILFPHEIKKDIIADFKIGELSGVFTYKKTDRFSDEVKNSFNTNLSSVISHIAFMRQGMIQKLFRAGVIRDLNVDEKKVFGTQELLKPLVKGKARGDYKIDKSALILSDTHFGIGKEIKQYDISNKKEIGGAIFINFLQNFITTYGEDELNEQLNLDDSYKKILFYNGNKQEIEDLRDSLIYGEGKKFIKSIKFKEGYAYINRNKLKFKTGDKADYILSLIAEYFTEYPLEDDVDVSDLEDLHISKGKPIKVDFIDSIRTGYLKTLNNRLEKKFINGRIFEIKKTTITIKEMNNYGNSSLG